ncbi:MAG: hypothetical protein CDV28_101145 [Candidatus Electronema aureum]|uniref:GmrSD restriction endonucleases N-terminal domain-containing protein n=1 Tax=Candidatus Electronema aureum TaxID=2005002 RepID=A0A521G5G6_9BACT|nr:MAG: hypothetical protein CDV28_101145 [Candidatus Electronema aureum]
MGSLLVMAKNEQLPMHSRYIDATIDISSVEEDKGADNIFYVLDGQQRLTSIARVFLNGDKNRTFYFDLKKMIEGIIDKDDDTSWIVTRSKNLESLDKGRFLRADIAVSNSKNTEIYVYRYIQNSGEFVSWEGNMELQCEAAAKIKDIFEGLRKYQIPIVELESDAGLKSICRVFETINSTGTRLTTFDLAVARFFPKPDLKAKWEDARSLHPVLGEFDVDGERVLQIIVLRYAEEKEKNNSAFVEVNRGTQLQLSPNYIEENWNEAVKALVRAFEWAKSMGARPKTLTNHALLVAIAAHWCARPMLPPDHLLLKRWFFSNLLQPGATQASNYRISRYFKLLRDLAAGKTDREIIPTVYITIEIILGLTQGSDSRFKALQCILSAAVSEDLYSGEPLVNEDIEEHHIYPKAYCEREKLNDKLRESIVNRIVLSKKSNRKILDTSPGKYFSEIINRAQESGTVPGTIARLRACFIPNSYSKEFNELSKITEQFTPAQFEIFMNNRAKLILEEIQMVIGDSLETKQKLENDDDDE